MKKKIFIAVFFALICIPSIGMLFYKTDAGAEKRNIQSFPQIKKEGKVNIKFFDELNNYFADNFAFRQEMIEGDAVIKKAVFSESGNDKVIVGKDGYLFFSETMDDYLGRNTLSERKIFSCGKVLSLLQENALNNNRKFLFVIAPNKNSIYPEYMPKRYIKVTSSNNYSMLKKEMEKQKINTVDLKDAIVKSGKKVYQRLDSHWNNQGAAMACNLMLNNLNKKHYDYSNEPYKVTKDFSGDLYEMLFPKGHKKDSNIKYLREHTYKVTSKINDVTAITYETESQGKNGSIVMYRDSFGNALIPFVADEYKNGYYTKAVPYDWQIPEEKDADTIVIELVERHISSLIEGTPDMPAPERQVNINPKEVKNMQTSLKVGDMEEYLPISGHVDKKYISNDGKIYVRLKNNKHQYIFEAFPTAMDENSKNDGYDFGMYLDTVICDVGTYDIDVITQKGNEYYSSGVKTELEFEE